MKPSLQTNVTIVEVLPERSTESPGPTKPSPTIRPGFTRSESTLVAQEIDEKALKSSLDVSPNIVPAQEILTQNKDLETGKLSSWRGTLIILVTGGAMFMDNVFMTSTNISLSAVQSEFDVPSSNLQWMISAYTLSFGGFLLLSGVLSDRSVNSFYYSRSTLLTLSLSRYGRKPMFVVGLTWLSIWTLAIGFGSSFIQITIFRGLQGIGAALTIPSAVGIISSYFTGQDRTRALGIYAASGAVGFTGGLVLGGLLSSSLGWRYIFRLSVIVSGLLAVLGLIILPPNRTKGNGQSRLDYFGASLSTAGLILLTFVLSGGGIYGWAKAFIIVLLILAVALLFMFTYVEKKISNPIMPLSLWKIRNFPSLWIIGFSGFSLSVFGFTAKYMGFIY